MPMMSLVWRLFLLTCYNTLMNNQIMRNAFVNAGATIIYIMLISSFMFYVPEHFNSNSEDVVLMPILMLSLLVFSAALVGILIFGKPIMWYLDDRKNDAVRLLSYTLGIFLAITILILVLLLLIIK